MSSRLEFYDVSSLRSAVAFNDFELNGLTFVERFESVALNSGEVDKNVKSFFIRNETVTFFRVEPFNSTSH